MSRRLSRAPDRRAADLPDPRPPRSAWPGRRMPPPPAHRCRTPCLPIPRLLNTRVDVALDRLPARAADHQHRDLIGRPLLAVNGPRQLGDPCAGGRPEDVLITLHTAGGGKRRRRSGYCRRKPPCWKSRCSVGIGAGDAGAGNDWRPRATPRFDKGQRRRHQDDADEPPNPHAPTDAHEPAAYGPARRGPTCMEHCSRRGLPPPPGSLARQTARVMPGLTAEETQGGLRRFPPSRADTVGGKVSCREQRKRTST